MNIKDIKQGDTILIKCKVEAVFAQSGMLKLSISDYDKVFDANVDEIVDMDNKWNKINKDLYNPNLTWKQNQQNGCNLPDQKSVLIYDEDEPKYLVGSISYDENRQRLAVYDSVSGRFYSGVNHIKWRYL